MQDFIYSLGVNIPNICILFSTSQNFSVKTLPGGCLNIWGHIYFEKRYFPLMGRKWVQKERLEESLPIKGHIYFDVFFYNMWGWRDLNHKSLGQQYILMPVELYSCWWVYLTFEHLIFCFFFFFNILKFSHVEPCSLILLKLNDKIVTWYDIWIVLWKYFIGL